MRRVAARMHLWGGLVTGPLLLVLGLSGSALVFGPELEQALDGPPVIATTATSAPSLDAVVAAAVVGQPGAEPRALRLPARPDQPYRVELTVGGTARILGPGEAYYFASQLPHRFRNVGREACEIISACTPPSF